MIQFGRLDAGLVGIQQHAQAILHIIYCAVLTGRVRLATSRQGENAHPTAGPLPGALPAKAHVPVLVAIAASPAQASPCIAQHCTLEFQNRRSPPYGTDTDSLLVALPAAPMVC